MPSPPKILLTGFGPFPGVSRNPSGILVREFPVVIENTDVGYDLVTRVLPTEFGTSARFLREAVREEEPDAILMLGVGGAGPLRLERLARNADEAGVLDAAGAHRDGGPIIDGGPETYISTLELNRMKSALTEAGIPVTYSDDAGAYVCNHAFYCVQHQLERTGAGTPCGFVHIPPPDEQPDPAGVTWEQLARAIVIMLEVVREAIVDRHAGPYPA